MRPSGIRFMTLFIVVSLLLISTGLFAQRAEQGAKTVATAQSAMVSSSHPEVTKAGFRRWQEAPWAYYAEPGAQDRATQDRLMAEHDARQEAWFHGFLGRLFK